MDTEDIWVRLRTCAQGPGSRAVQPILEVPTLLRRARSLVPSPMTGSSPMLGLTIGAPEAAPRRKLTNPMWITISSVHISSMMYGVAPSVLKGLKERPRSGRPRKLDLDGVMEILTKTAEEDPPGATSPI